MCASAISAVVSTSLGCGWSILSKDEPNGSRGSFVVSARILQQIVCYDSSNSVTVFVVWGYAIQVYGSDKFLPDLLSLQKTFLNGGRGSGVQSNYMFNARDPRDRCGRPLVFFLDSVGSDGTRGTWSNYTRYSVENCRRAEANYASKTGLSTVL